jgi:hypothetical protein
MSTAEFRQTLVVAPPDNQDALSVVDFGGEEHLAVDSDGNVRIQSGDSYVRVLESGVEISGAPVSITGAPVNISGGAVNISGAPGEDVTISASGGGAVIIEGLAVAGVYSGDFALSNSAAAPTVIGLGPAAGAGSLQVACRGDSDAAAVFLLARGGARSIATRAMSLPGAGGEELLAAWGAGGVTLRFSADVNGGAGTTEANVVFACAGF